MKALHSGIRPMDVRSFERMEPCEARPFGECRSNLSAHVTKRLRFINLAFVETFLRDKRGKNSLFQSFRTTAAGGYKGLKHGMSFVFMLQNIGGSVRYIINGKTGKASFAQEPDSLAQIGAAILEICCRPSHNGNYFF
jgi:hypothetical protein